MDKLPTVFQFDAREIFTLLFIMLGPIKLLGPFARITASSTEGESRGYAWKAILIAVATVLAASFIGCAMLEKWNVSPGALAIAGGILFFSVAFDIVIRPYRNDQAPGPAPAPAGPRAILGQLVPAIVSPYGIAAVILILTISPGSTLQVVEMLVGIMALDLLAMLVARKIIPLIALPLQIVGTVMGVLQVALSVQIVVYGVHLIAVSKFGVKGP